MDLQATRFYGAKSEPIDAQTVAASAPAGEFTWQIVEVTHGGQQDLYQVLGDASDADALHTAPGAQAYLEHVNEFGEVHGTVSGEHARPLGADQSNTSLVVDEQFILKVFRRLEEGMNPDVELLRAIADHPHVAGVTGHVTRDGRTLAMMQELIHGGRDGFQLALQEDIDTFALGQAIRSVHESLAGAFGTVTVPGSQLRDFLNAHLDELLPQANALTAHEETLRGIYSAIPDDDAQIHRIHGDLHLGQTLLTVDEAHTGHWYLIDFEGEPARPLEQRRRPDHPLRDLAGMVRSLGYAHAMDGYGDADALLAGYGVTASPILDAYIADKAAYEVVYEANNRPDWVEIPLRAIRELST